MASTVVSVPSIVEEVHHLKAIIKCYQKYNSQLYLKVHSIDEKHLISYRQMEIE